MKYLFGLALLSSYAVAGPTFIGGRRALPTEYPASVQLKTFAGKCTGAKIGPRLFLTAAHCVLKKSTAEKDVDKDILIDISTNDGKKVSTVVEASYVNPAYLREKTRLMGQQNLFNNIGADVMKGLESYTSFRSADIAIIKVEDYTPEIRQVNVDFNDVLQGEKMIAGGYGCDRLGGTSTNQYFFAEVRNTYRRVDFDPHWSTADKETDRIEGKNLISMNNLAFVASNGINAVCPGDSGGPLYRASTKTVIGVNSFVMSANGVAFSSFAGRVVSLAAWMRQVTQNFGALDKQK